MKELKVSREDMVFYSPKEGVIFVADLKIAIRTALCGKLADYLIHENKEVDPDILSKMANEEFVGAVSIGEL